MAARWHPAPVAALLWATRTAREPFAVRSRLLRAQIFARREIGVSPGAPGPGRASAGASRGIEPVAWRRRGGTFVDQRTSPTSPAPQLQGPSAFERATNEASLQERSRASDRRGGHGRRSFRAAPVRGVGWCRPSVGPASIPAGEALLGASAKTPLSGTASGI